MNDINAVLAAIRKSMILPSEEISKAFTQSGSPTTGMTYYDLEAGAKYLQPEVTPIRNKLARVKGNGGIQANWKAVTKVNNPSVGWGVSEGNRGPVIGTTAADYAAVYKTLGLEDSLTREADLAAEGFEDLKTLVIRGLLTATMTQEERVVVGGNSSLALGTTATPAVTTATTGGTLAALTYSIICVAMTLEGYVRSTVAGGVPPSAARTLADGTTEAHNDGTAQKSVAATQITTGATSTISATVAVPNGAVAYAWYWGVGGSELLGAITTINSVLITAAATGTQNASAGFASDKSQNSKVFDGLITQAMLGSSSAYIKTMANGVAGTGTPLTGSGNGTITEFEEVFRNFWDTLRLSPTQIYVSSQEMDNIRNKALAQTSTSARRIEFSMTPGGVMAGTSVASYVNTYAIGGPKVVPISIHPDVPPGTVLFITEVLPYPMAGIANVLQMKMRQDYYVETWPRSTRKDTFGVYSSGVLQNYFPTSLAIIRNIGNG